MVAPRKKESWIRTAKRRGLLLASSWTCLGGCAAAVCAVAGVSTLLGSAADLPLHDSLLSYAAADVPMTVPMTVGETYRDNSSSQRPDYHVVFSTSCHEQQDWMSYVFFYHAMIVKQPGNVTRIASACTPEKQDKLRSFFEQYIQPMRPDGFHLHFTPDYSRVRLAKGKPYKYMNKPYGLRHWMENVLGMNPDTMQAPSKRTEDAIVILMDPDMILLRPILHDFSDVENHIWVEESPLTRVVKHSFPIAQQDGYLTNNWMNLDVGYITKQEKGQHVPLPSQGDSPLHYITGPPYLATVRDMYRIVVKWCEYAPRVVEIHPVLFAEMKGFMHSTVQLKLPFTLIKSIVISNSKSPDREGWPFVDALADDHICDPPVSARLPIGLHYCKNYATGKWFFGKYFLKENILNCDKSLIRPPPRDLASRNLTYFIDPPGFGPHALQNYVEKRVPLTSPLKSRRDPFMMCALTKAVNQAVSYHKWSACVGGGNQVENYTVYEDPSLH